MAAIALRIRQSLDLEVILKQTVEEVRQFLNTDRVIIYRFEPDWSGIVVVESVVAPWKSVFGSTIKDPCFSTQHIEAYRHGHIQVVKDIYDANLTKCYIDLLAQFQVQANLVVPIVADDNLWGLLIAQHCQSTRQWSDSEVELLKHLATQVGIAIQQAELHQQVQSLNTYLEKKVKKRTANLQRSFQFEALIRSITEKVRDSLDETQILYTVTQEIGRVLKIERCKIELYDQDRTTATIAYEYANNIPVCQGTIRKVADFPELYTQLLQKQSLQFVEIIPELSPKKIQATRLVCPIYDDRGILGNLWLLKPKEEIFDPLEMRLVEQVANQCAIAIRQARLYKTSQAQVEELGKLNTLKDDFLKTISHELRTPMSSILLASQTLEKLVQTQGLRGIKSRSFQRVFQIFKSSCQQQNKLVSDLLTLCYVDADSTVLIPELIDLQKWLPELVKPFQEQIERQQQQLILDIADDTPLLQSDVSLLERVVNELINNACKYTPGGEIITIKTWAVADKIFLSVSNSGVEIPVEEQQHIFDKFYRIPSHDPWQYGGTGIGLALVKKLVELLSASVTVESNCDRTSFILQFSVS
ncbi:MAG: hypothetical protein Tsb0014_02540 [Pleurocapsa sp.]